MNNSSHAKRMLPNLIQDAVQLENMPIRRIDALIGSIRDVILSYTIMERRYIEIESRLKLFDLSGDSVGKSIPASLFSGLMLQLSELRFPHTTEEYTRIWYGRTGLRATQKGDIITVENKQSAEDIIDLNNWCKYNVSKEILEFRLTVKDEELNIDNFIMYLNQQRATLRGNPAKTTSIITPSTKRIYDVILSVKPENMTRQVSKRTSFTLSKYGVRVDMTESKSETGIMYSVEVEMLSKLQLNIDKPLVDLIAATKMVARLLRGSDYYYTQASIKSMNILLNLNLLLSDCNGNTIKDAKREPLDYAFTLDRRVMNDVRPLQPYDIAMGGIVLGDTIYGISHKTDGEKRLLVITSWGIWLILPPHSYNLILDAEAINGRVNGDDLTVIEGELIPAKNVKNEEMASSWKYHFEVIDFHFVSGYDVRCEVLPMRLKLGNKYIKSSFIADNEDIFQNIHITFKSVKEIRNVDNMRYLIRDYLDQVDSYPYKTDGLIFTPVNKGYSTGYDFRMKTQLSSTKPILKWKSPYDTTIDFYVGENYELEVDTRGEEITTEVKRTVFVGDSQYIFTAENVNVKNIPQHARGFVCEFGLDEGGSGLLEYRRTRADKISPNSDFVAKSNWRNIMNPITDGTLLGYGLRIAKYYHNRIKDKLYEKSPGGILLDIGSGLGGDANKWKKHYPIVIAIESNPEYIPELKRRCTLAGYHVMEKLEEITTMTEGDFFVYIINDDASSKSCLMKVDTAIQTMSTITKLEDVSCISMMDSATFFWESEDKLKGLINLIYRALSNGGSLIWKAMDGDIVNKRLDGGDALRYSDEFAIKLEDRETGKITVSMEGIVGKGQVEYLTVMSKIIPLLDTIENSKNKYKMTEEYIATGTENDFKYILGEDASNYTSLYKYGIITKGNGKVNPLILPEKKIVDEKIQGSSIEDNVPKEESIPKDKFSLRTHDSRARGTMRSIGGRGRGRGRGRGFGLSGIQQIKK